MVLHKVKMWEKLLIICLLAWGVHGQYFDRLDNLGDRIAARVAAQVAPLEGLGQRINDQVQQSLRPMQMLPGNIINYIIMDEEEKRHISKAQLNSRLSDLDGLGDRISEQVYNNLEPVRAIELNFKMKGGVGGVTVVTHQPGGRRLIVKNNRVYTCDSRIDVETGNCAGQLIPFKITSSSPDADWCYVESYSMVNDKICLSTGSVSIEAYNGVVSCRSDNNDPIRQMTLDDYKKLCSGIRDSTEYRYIPNLSDRNHVEIPNQNKYVKCENRQDNLCIFHEDNQLLKSSYNHGNVLVQGLSGASIVIHS